MKIGIDIRVLLDKHYSGVSEYTYNLLQEILKQDKDNEYYLFYNSWHNLSSRIKIKESERVKIIKTSYPNKVFNYLLQKFFFYPKIDKLLGGVDVFWAPHFNFLSLSNNTKFIITIHDLSFLRYPEFFSWRKNFWHQAIGIKKLVNRAKIIIAVSENTKNDLVELLGVKEEKIRVIYSGNNLKKEEVSEKKDKDYILYLGNIEPRKNIINLITGYNQLRERGYDLDLVLAGSIAWKKKGFVRAWKSSPYAKDIKILGYINEEQKKVLYSQAKLFVYPSFYEGFGFPPLEAMTYGIPVISSNVSSLPEIVGKAGIMINPFSSQDIFLAMKEVLDHNDLREELIREGYKQVEKFKWEKSAKEYIEVIKNI